MNIVISDLNSKKEIIAAFEKVLHEVNEFYEDNTTDYYQSNIAIVDRDGNKVTDFYTRYISMRGIKKVSELAYKTRLFNGTYWEDEETPMGLEAARALALYSKDYINAFKAFIKSTDLDHQVYQVDYIFEICGHHGWFEDTYSLYVFGMFNTQQMEGCFPSDSIVEHLKAHPDEVELIKDILKKELDAYNSKFGISNYGNERYDEWLDLLNRSLLPPSSDMVKVDARDKKIYLDPKLKIDVDILSEILLNQGYHLTEDKTTAEILVSNSLRKAEGEIVKLKEFISIDSYKSFINDYTEDFSDYLREEDEDGLRKLIVPFMAMRKYINRDLLCSYMDSLSTDFIKEMVEKHGFGEVIKDATSDNYGLLLSLCDLRDEDGIEKLEYLSEKGLVNFYIDYDIRKEGEFNYVPPLFMAIDSIDDIEFVKKTIDYLLEKGANLEDRYDINSWISTPLLGKALFSKSPNLDLIEFLIEKGSDVNYSWDSYDSDNNLYRNNYLTELLKNTGPNKDVSIIKLLIEKGASLEITELYNPIFNAVDSGNTEIIEYIFSKGSFDINAKNYAGHSLVYKVASSIDALKFLLEKGADISSTGFRGNNLLTAIAGNKNPTMVEYLLNNGINVNHTTDNGTSALHQACYYFQTEIVRILLHYGIDTTIKNEDGNTAKEVLDDRYEATKPWRDGESHKNKYSYRNINELLNIVKNRNLEDLNINGDIGKTLDNLIENINSCNGEGFILKTNFSNLGREAIEKGYEEKLTTLIKALIEKSRVIYKSPLALLGFDEAIELADYNLKYTDLLNEYITTLGDLESINPLYKHRDRIIEFVKKHSNRESFRSYINGMITFKGLVIGADLRKILGKEGELYDLFFGLLKDMVSKEIYDNYLDDYQFWLGYM